MDKVVSSAEEAVADIGDGASLAVGGFGLCGIPSVLIRALHEQGATDLELVSNNCGVDDWGLGRLLMAKRLRRVQSAVSQAIVPGSVTRRPSQSKTTSPLVTISTNSPSLLPKCL